MDLPGGTDAPVLSIRDLSVHFDGSDGIVRATAGVSYDVHAGEIVGVVGESGSGKSVTVLTALGLIPRPPAVVAGGSALYDGRDLLAMSPRELQRLRGGEIGFVFQDPMSSFNPVLTIGAHLREALVLHARRSKEEVRERSLELLRTVGIPEPEARLRQFPHELSGGMRQRVMFAIAVANRPHLLIADEPTTALDVSVQAQLLQVLRKAQQETGAATVLITHDLGVIAEVATRVVVMYAGAVVEDAPVRELFHAPRHPYTRALLDSLPRLDRERDERLQGIPGQPPSLRTPIRGCAFAARCTRASGRAICVEKAPVRVQLGRAHDVACHFPDESGTRTTQEEVVVR